MKLTAKAHRVLLDIAACMVLVSAALPTLDVGLIGLTDTEVGRVLASLTAAAVLLANVARRIADPDTSG